MKLIIANLLFNMPSTSRKNSYHPYILVAFYFNCLPENILSSIPRSTIFDWRHRDIDASFGYDWCKENENQFKALQAIAQNEKLLAINKALLRVIAIKRFVEANITGLKIGNKALKEVVVASIQKAACTIGLKQTLRYLRMSFNFYSALKRKIACTTSTISLCRVKHPSQLLQKEIATIQKYCTETSFQFWPLSAVYHQMTKDGACHLTLSTFYKYVALLNLKRSSARNRRKNHETGIRASEPLQVLHADLTEFKTADNQKAYIYLVQDNFSRTILSHRVERERRAYHTFENMEKVKQKYLAPSGISKCTLISDDGSENYGELKKWLYESKHPTVNHIIAQIDVHYSNSMIEAANKQLKYRFLYHQHIANYTQLIEYLDRAVEDFNNRPHHVLQGLSPLEVLNGNCYNDNKTMQLMQLAKQNRLTENQKVNCCHY